MDDKKPKKPLAYGEVDAAKFGVIKKDFPANVIRTDEILPQYTGEEWTNRTSDLKLDKKLAQVGNYASDEAKDVGRKLKDVAKELLASGKKEAAVELLTRARGAMFKNAAKWGMKSLPLVGGIAAAMYEGDASAAIPILNEADSLGPAPGSIGAQMEDPRLSDEQRTKIMDALKDKYKTQY